MRPSCRSRVTLSARDLRANHHRGRYSRSPAFVRVEPLRSFGSALIPALWLAWLAYWWIAGLHTHEVRQRESVSSRLSHALPLLAGVVLFASPPLAPSWLSERAFPRTLFTYWIGVAGLLAGLGFSNWAR